MWPDASLGVQRTKTKDVRNSGCWNVVRQTVREKQDTVNFRVKCTLSCATLAKHAHWSAGKLKQKEASRYKHKHARTILVTRNKFSNRRTRDIAMIFHPSLHPTWHQELQECTFWPDTSRPVDSLKWSLFSHKGSATSASFQYRWRLM